MVRFILQVVRVCLCVTLVYCEQPPFPQIDIMRAVVIVWRVRRKTIRSVLCNIVCTVRCTHI